MTPDDALGHLLGVTPVVVRQRQRVRPDEVKVVLVRHQVPANRTQGSQSHRRETLVRPVAFAGRKVDRGTRG